MIPRRSFLLQSGVAAGVPAAAPRPPSRFGVQAFSYSARVRDDPSVRDPETFLRFCRERGAGGVQTAIPPLDAPAVRRLRELQEKEGLWLEGSVRLPADAADTERFARDCRAAREAGAAVVRTVMLSGRRYETFRTAEAYREFRVRSAKSVELAAAEVARLKLRLAIENHKDYRTGELVDLIRRIGSEYVGVTLDTGNNLALLERPTDTFDPLIPLAFAVHLKDMGLEEYESGIRIAEVPFGTGILALPDLVRRLIKARPEIRFSIEMATRDPLDVPCLTDAYWAVMEGVPALDLARTLALARSRPGAPPLPRPSRLPPAELLRAEDENVRRCLKTVAGYPDR